MKFIKKAWEFFYIRMRFLLEQKWGLIKPKDPFAISKSILRKYLPLNPVIIDCGAHVGVDSIGLAIIFPKAVIHSFEPVPEVFSELKRNTAPYGNIKIYPVALSNSDATATMFVSSGASDGSSSLLAPATHLLDHPEVFFEKRIEVKTQTLDTWAKENNISVADFLWLDMQGFEFIMLKESTIILPTVKVIFTEVSTKETYKGCILYADFKSWLEKNGFGVVLEKIPFGADMGNVLFVRK